MSNKFCWADVLGDCAGPITREHLVSKATYRDAKTVHVKGFEWCLQDKVEVGINAVTSYILCSVRTTTR